MNRRLYAIHRWLSAAALVQLAVWVISGSFFAIVPLTRVKGSSVEGAHVAPIAPNAELISPSQVTGRLAAEGPVSRLDLVGTPEGPFYRGRVGKRRFRVDAITGQERAVEEAEARVIASRDQAGAPRVVAISRVERDPPVEYRGRPLPAWRAVLDDKHGTVVYVDALTGEVTAHRNDLWRIYDFLWSLHIMDYGARESFNHPLLIAAALLGVVTVSSGAVLWAVRAYRFWSGRKRRATRPPGDDARAAS